MDNCSLFPECHSCDFYTEFSELLSILQSIPGMHVLLSDFNFHVNDPEDTHARKFTALIKQYYFRQHVTFPTHNAGDFNFHVNDPEDTHASNLQP